jgi:hypothetical protein
MGPNQFNSFNKHRSVNDQGSAVVLVIMSLAEAIGCAPLIAPRLCDSAMNLYNGV